MVESEMRPWWVRKRLVLLAGIILLGTFIRFFLLRDLPPGLYPDEAMNGLDALRALDRADFKVFYPENNGREGLHVGILALAFQMFTASAYVLRATSAFLGSLTIAAVGLLGYEVGARLKKLLGGHAPTTMMLLSAFLIAVSSWHVHFSRIGFRAILLPLLSALTVAYLLRLLRRRRISDAAVSGFALGLSLSTYIASRILPVVLAIPALFDIIRNRSDRKVITLWAVFVVSVLLAVFPLAGYFIANPADFLGRAGGVSIFATDSPLTSLFVSTAKTLLMFNVLGDGNWRHGAAGLPVLDLLTGILLLAGLFVLAHRGRKNGTLWLLLIWFGAMLLPAAATFEGIPHALRTFGAVVPAMLLAAVGGLWLFRLLGQRASRVFRLSALSLVIVLIAFLNINRTFSAWGGATEELDGAFRADLARVSETLNERLAERDAKSSAILDYVVINEGGVLLDGVAMPSATIKFMTLDDPRIRYLRPDQLDEIEPTPGETRIFITEEPNEELDTALRTAFPALTRKEYNGFTVYQL